MANNNKPRILLIDIETLPNIVTNWGLWADNGISHDNILQERSIVCAAWKWLGESTVHSVQVLSKSPLEDKHIVLAMQSAFNQSDAVVGHNSCSFDIKWINARAMFHGLPPMKDIIQIDTKKIAKEKFYFNSNRLDYLGKFLKLGCKIKTDFKLWQDCMKGDAKAIKEMVRYNKQDVLLLEKVYLKLSPYVKTALNFNVVAGSTDKCPHCGSGSLQKRGSGYTKTSTYERYQCQAKGCGRWSSGPRTASKGVLR